MNLKLLHQQTKMIYSDNAVQYDAERGKHLFERVWLERFETHLPERGTILDLGCGTGDPISRYFIERGYQITGVDFAEPMLDIARNRFSKQVWLNQDIRALTLQKTFDGIIAWGSFFHLNRDEQRQHFDVFSKHLKDDGVVLVTIGPEDGEVTGTINGVSVYHSSLDLNEYRTLADKLGLKVLFYRLNDVDCQGHSVLLLRKISS